MGNAAIMTIHENLERVVNANPWRAVAFLLIAAIGLASTGGVYVGAAGLGTVI